MNDVEGEPVRPGWGRGFGLTIRLKVALLGLLVGLAQALVLIPDLVGETRIAAAQARQDQYQAAADQASALRFAGQRLAILQQDLIVRRQADAAAAWRAQLAETKAGTARLAATGIAPAADIAALGEQLAAMETGFASADIAALGEQLAAMETGFARLEPAVVSLGFADDQGLRGALNRTAGAVEDELKKWPNVDALAAKINLMRRLERDYMLYGEAATLGRIKRTVNEFDFALDASPLPPGDRDAFRKLILQYGKDVAAYGAGQKSAQAEVAGLEAIGASLVPVLDRLFDAAGRGAKAAAAERERLSDQVGLIVLALCAVVFLISLGLAILIGRSITRPIARITAVMGELAGGNLAVEVEGKERADEVGGMARAVEIFRTQAADVARLEVARKQTEAKSLKDQRAALRGMANTVETETVSAVDRVAGRTEQMAKAAGEMAMTADDASSGSRGVVGAAENALNNAQAVATAADSLSASIEGIVVRVRDQSRIAGEAADKAHQTSATVETLNAATTKINDVVDLIHAIADQTNMLALNATIEAARAGEAGKGFAVVASEVKNLANQTARATEEISTQVEGMRDLTKACVEAIEDISTVITAMNDIAGAIAGAMDSQSNATREISESINRVATASREVNAGIADVAKVAQRSQRLAADVTGFAGDLTEAVADLRTTLTRIVRTATSDVNRRQDMRLVPHPPIAATVFKPGGGSLSADVLDISSGGCALAPLPDLAAGRHLEITFAGVLGRWPVILLKQESHASHFQIEGELEERGELLVYVTRLWHKEFGGRR